MASCAHVAESLHACLADPWHTADASVRATLAVSCHLAAAYLVVDGNADVTALQLSICLTRSTATKCIQIRLYLHSCL